MLKALNTWKVGTFNSSYWIRSLPEGSRGLSKIAFNSSYWILSLIFDWVLWIVFTSLKYVGWVYKCFSWWSWAPDQPCSCWIDLGSSHVSMGRSVGDLWDTHMVHNTVNHIVLFRSCEQFCGCAWSSHVCHGTFSAGWSRGVLVLCLLPLSLLTVYVSVRGPCGSWACC